MTNDRETKRYWRNLASQWGYDYISLNAVYQELRSIEQIQLDLERDVRVSATRLLFPTFQSPDRWWVILHNRLERLVGDSDLNVIANFDDKARILASEFPVLDRGDALLTTQHVFEYLIATPGHMLVPVLSEVMKQAWNNAFGEDPPAPINVDELQDVPF